MMVSSNTDQRGAAVTAPTWQDMAKAILRKEEGFSANPYWDVNAQRAGYGSDTTIGPDGLPIPIKKGMTVSREQAEADLDYRLTQREGAMVQKQLGPAWDNLPDSAKAVLASVGYNYGSLPSSVVNAAKTGDLNQISYAVSNLSSNPERRQREASLISSPNGFNALSYANDTTNRGNGASAALNSMAQGTQVADASGNVPPPFSGQTANFPTVVATPQYPQQQQYQLQETPQQAVTTQQQTQPDYGALMQKFGLSDDGLAQQAQPQGQSTPANSNDALIKTWGLDKTDASPVEGMAASQATAPDSKIGVNDVIRSIGTGAPVIGGLLNKMDAATNAAIAPIVNPMLSDENKLKGETWSERYANSLAQQEGMDAQYAKEHPIANTAGNIAGGVGGSLLMMRAAPALMGASTTAPLATNMLMGGASGATLGGVDAAIRSGGDVNQAVKGAEMGGAFGAAGPAIGKAVGWGANKLMSGIRNLTPSGSAANNLTQALEASGTTPDQIATEMARNPRLTAMDIDPNLQQMGMNLANQGGAPRSILSDAAAARSATAKQAVNDAFDQSLGQAPDVKAYLDNIKQTASTNGAQNFTEALSNAKPVNTQPVLEAIDAKLFPGVNSAVSKASNIPQGPVENALARVRAQLANGNEMLTDPQRLHQIQSQLRVEADTLGNSASGQDRLVANALRDVRQKIVSSIDDASGGKYRPAQKQYADDMSINDAFDKGRQILTGGTTSDAALQNRPEYWKDWAKNASQPELDAAKLGARIAVDQQINSVRSAAAKGASIPDVGFSRDRLEILLGKAETDKLAQALADEQKIASTNAKLFAGSQTAPRQAVNNLTKVTEVTPGISLTTPMAGGIGFQVGGIPGAAAGAGLSLANKGVQAAFRARDVARNKLMAEAISGSAPDFVTAANANRLIGQRATAIGSGTNRLLSATAPTAANQLTAAQSNRKPLEITVRPKKR